MNHSTGSACLHLQSVPDAAMPARVAIAGATGYAGIELASILGRHPHAEVVASFSSSTLSADAVASSAPDVAFLATPNEVSAHLVPQLLDRGIRVVDLSGSFRLQDAAAYPSWYRFDHPRPDLLREAVYGLPEWCTADLRETRLVANPGCYPTSILLALRPLANVLDRTQPLICDAKSGVSGAGRRSESEYSFTELFGNFKAYGVGGHRHEPEIRQELRLGDRAQVCFVPHLIPVARGIYSTMHVSFTRPVGALELTEAYRNAYSETPFVRVLEAGRIPELKNVVNTPFAEIGFASLHAGRRAVIVCAIDNLLKGAASQAVQNFNRMLGHPETEGLL